MNESRLVVLIPPPHFLGNTGLTDITDSVRKFYGKFNNIMVVLSKHPNEMSALHLIKTYCLPCYIVVKSGTWTTLTCIKSQWNGITVSEVSFYVVGETVLNHYNTFVVHYQCHNI